VSASESTDPTLARRWREAISWRLAVEVLRRHPGELRLLEAHGGGGQYDELRIYQRVDLNADSPFLISFNRAGGVHFGIPGVESWHIWAYAFSRDDPKQVVDELERRAGLVSHGKLPAETPDVLTLRVIAALLGSAAFERGQWEARSGSFDSSGYDTSAREELFEPFPLCQGRLTQSEPSDILGEPAFRFWFLLRDHKPLLAFEDTGRVWDRDGEEINLLSRFRREQRLWPLTAELGGRIFR
jgi:hypothetical protein